MWARSLSLSRRFATPARELKDRLGSHCLLPLTGFELHLSELHPKQQKQIQPQHTHEMPVARRGVQSGTSQRGIVQLSYHTDQTAEPSEDVQRMSYSQHVEE